VSFGRQLHQIAVTGVIRGQQCEVKRSTGTVGSAAAGNVSLVPDDGIESMLLGSPIEVNRSEHDPVIGKCQRAHLVSSGLINQPRYATKAVEQAEIRVDMKMREFGQLDSNLGTVPSILCRAPQAVLPVPVTATRLHSRQAQSWRRPVTWPPNRIASTSGASLEILPDKG
jgi:hypothetical protein